MTTKSQAIDTPGIKHTISLNSYPANYVEEDLPDVSVEIRYRKDDTDSNQEEAKLLACYLGEVLRQYRFGVGASPTNR